MITHNGTYLLFATHHGMRITAATMGGKLMLSWLLSATQQAILAAFGSAEGTEVILRTNDYLNAIALTDPTRAQQLANFINEDPLLVCSLVETSKTRWLVGDGKAWIDLGYVPVGDDVETYTKFIVTEQGQVAKGIFGKGSYQSQTNSIYISTWFNNLYKNLVMHGVTTAQGAWFGDTTGNKVDYTWELTQILKDGVYDAISLADGTPKADGWGQAKAASPLVDDGVHCFLFKTSTYNAFKGKIGEHYEKEQGVFKHRFLPFIRNGENGMLDILSGTFHPNANTEGAFTIALTDKTPA